MSVHHASPVGVSRSLVPAEAIRRAATSVARLLLGSPSTGSGRRIGEALESRRLLTATFNESLGLAIVNGTSSADIIQIQVGDEVDDQGRPTTFEVVESTPDADFSTYAGDLAAYIADATETNRTEFSIEQINELRINGSGGNDLIILGQRLPVASRIDGGQGNDAISGSLGRDTLTGNEGDDYLFGGLNNDLTAGGDDSDWMLGGEGNDSSDYRVRTDGVDVGIGTLFDDGNSNDQPLGGTHWFAARSPGDLDNVANDIEILIGGSGDDDLSTPSSGTEGRSFQLFGGLGDDTLNGSVGEDLFYGGGGADSILGNDGDDFIFSEDATTDTVNGGNGEDVLLSDTGTTADVVSNVEVIADELADAADPTVIEGGNATLDGTTLRVDGTSDDDTIIVRPSTDGNSIFVIETNDDDTFVSEFDAALVESMVLRGGSGSDTIISLVDVDATLEGSTGDDTLIGSGAEDTILGGTGADLIFGRDGDDLFDGGTESDIIAGGEDEDTMDYSTRPGNLTIGLGELPDDGEPGEGDNVQTDIEIVLGGSGSDSVSTIADLPVQFFGFAGNDTLTGGGADDFLDGGIGRDRLVGNDGDDFFAAEDGAIDTIIGGDGDDDGDFDDDDVIESLGEPSIPA